MKCNVIFCYAKALLHSKLNFENFYWRTGCERGLIFEGVYEIRPYVTFDVKSHSPFVSQVNSRQF